MAVSGLQKAMVSLMAPRLAGRPQTLGCEVEMLGIVQGRVMGRMSREEEVVAVPRDPWGSADTLQSGQTEYLEQPVADMLPSLVERSDSSE